MKLSLRGLQVGFIISSIASLCSAQPQRTPPIESPIVHPDRTVTFNIKAPDAKKVELSGQFLKSPQALQKDDAGVWSVTVGPIEPNLYPYNFVIDGMGVADPGNMYIFPNERFKASLVDIPAASPALYQMQDVPHGEVTYCYYNSKTLNSVRPLLVYTPPGYRDGRDNYPVLYLVSGTTDTEETWFKVGHANNIIDNLIAQKKAKPMIIVMPYGNMMMGMPPPTSLQAAEMYKKFSDELTENILPYVEEHYRVNKDRSQRAIAGFSRGGGESLFTGFSHLDQFSYIGSYSAYLTAEVFDKYFPDLTRDPDATNKKLKLLWLGVGKDDFLYPQAEGFMEFVEQHKLQSKTLLTEGGHTWMNARHYLIETLQLYFKD